LVHILLRRLLASQSVGKFTIRQSRHIRDVSAYLFLKGHPVLKLSTQFFVAV
jgi:hypothetical protein